MDNTERTAPQEEDYRRCPSGTSIRSPDRLRNPLVRQELQKI